MMRRRWEGVGAVVLAAVVLAGCGGGASDVPVVIGSQAAFEGAAGVMQSPEQQAGDQATAAVREYYAVLDQVESDRGVDVGRLGEVTVEPMTAMVAREVETAREAGVVVSGVRRVAAVTVGSVVAPKDEDGAPVAGEASAELRVCLDWSGYESVGVDGGVTDPDRPETSLSKPSLVNAVWPDPSGWRVSWDLQTSVLQGYQPCDAP